MDNDQKNEQWEIIWHSRQEQARRLIFTLGQGLHYRVVVSDENDRERFLQSFLRPPETVLLAADGGLLNNLKIDENVLLPLMYRGDQSVVPEELVLELFARCGIDAAQTSLLLTRLPYQLSPYQKRAVGFVRSVLLKPKVMVYASVLQGVTQVESKQIAGFDQILRCYEPACTSVFIDYDTHMDAFLHAHQTFIL